MDQGIHHLLQSGRILWGQEYWSSDFPGGPLVKTFNAGASGSISAQGIKISYALWLKNQNIKQKQYCNTFHKDFKNGSHRKKEYWDKQTNRLNQGHPVSLNSWIKWNLELVLLKAGRLHRPSLPINFVPFLSAFPLALPSHTSSQWWDFNPLCGSQWRVNLHFLYFNYKIIQREVWKG